MQAIAKEVRELVKGHRPVGDGETHQMAVRDADAVAKFFRHAVVVNTRMNAPADDQHRPRLRREFWPHPALEKARGLRHAGAGAVDPEDAIGLHVKIAGAAAHVGAVEGPPILDVKPDRRAVLVIHAGVHGEDERLSLALQIAQDARESAVGLAFLVAQKQANVALARVEVAHRIGDAVVLDLGAGSGIGGGPRCEEKRQSGPDRQNFQIASEHANPLFCAARRTSFLPIVETAMRKHRFGAMSFPAGRRPDRESRTTS